MWGNNPVDYQGKHYESLADLARDYNVHPDTFRVRLKNGMSTEEALRKDPKVKGKTVMYKGVLYQNYKSLAKAIGISVDTIRNRLNTGMSLDEALSKSTSNVVVVFNKTFSNLKELADTYDISYDVLSTLKRKGIPLETAVKSLINSRIVYKGKKYGTLKKLAKDYNIGEDALVTRIRKRGGIHKISEEELGLCIQEALEYKKKFQVEHRGVVYNTLMDLTKDYGVDYSTIKSRMRLGMTLEESIEYHNTNKIETTVNGRVFKTRKELAKHYGVSEKTLKNRLDLGYSLEQALGLKKIFVYPKDFINENFGRLGVKQYMYTGRNGLWYFDCECKCGVHIVVNNKELEDCKVMSCGNCGGK